MAQLHHQGHYAARSEPHPVRAHRPLPCMVRSEGAAPFHLLDVLVQAPGRGATDHSPETLQPHCHHSATEALPPPDSAQPGVDVPAPGHPQSRGGRSQRLALTNGRPPARAVPEHGSQPTGVWHQAPQLPTASLVLLLPIRSGGARRVAPRSAASAPGASPPLRGVSVTWS